MVKPSLLYVCHNALGLLLSVGYAKVTQPFQELNSPLYMHLCLYLFWPSLYLFINFIGAIVIKLAPSSLDDVHILAAALVETSFHVGYCHVCFTCCIK